MTWEQRVFLAWMLYCIAVWVVFECRYRISDWWWRRKLYRRLRKRYKQ